MDFPFDFESTLRPKRPMAPPTVEDDDDEFALPVAPPAPSSADGAVSALSEDLMTPTKAENDEHDPASLPSSATAEEGTKSGEQHTEDETKPFDNTDFLSFGQVICQHQARWKTIKTEELVWCGDQPALVVPLTLHLSVPSGIRIPTHDGVMTFGPKAKDLETKQTRYVVVQYLPLCRTRRDVPRCEYEIVKGQKVENVLPYNTLLEPSRAKRGGGCLGPRDKWADTHAHFTRIKKKPKPPTAHTWNASLKFAQKYLDQALKLKAERIKKARNEEERMKKDMKEVKRRELEEAEARRRRGESPTKESDQRDKQKVVKSSGAAVKITPGLDLKCGDKIFYWDRTKIAGVASSRRVATIVEIKSSRGAQEDGTARLVLNTNEVVMDDWIIQKYIKDEETGKMKLDARGDQVKNYRLRKAKLKGDEGLRDKLMDSLLDNFQKDMKEYGAGDQLRGGGKDSDDENDERGRTGEKAPKDKVVGSGKASKARSKPATHDFKKKRKVNARVILVDKGTADGDDEVNAIAASIAAKSRGGGSEKAGCETSSKADGTKEPVKKSKGSQKRSVEAISDGGGDDGIDGRTDEEVGRPKKKKQKLAKAQAQDAVGVKRKEREPAPAVTSLGKGNGRDSKSGGSKGAEEKKQGRTKRRTIVVSDEEDDDDGDDGNASDRLQAEKKRLKRPKIDEKAKQSMRKWELPDAGAIPVDLPREEEKKSKWDKKAAASGASNTTDSDEKEPSRVEERVFEEIKQGTNPATVPAQSNSNSSSNDRERPEKSDPEGSSSSTREQSQEKETAREIVSADTSESVRAIAAEDGKRVDPTNEKGRDDPSDNSDTKRPNQEDGSAGTHSEATKQAEQRPTHEAEEEKKPDHQQHQQQQQQEGNAYPEIRAADLSKGLDKVKATPTAAEVVAVVDIANEAIPASTSIEERVPMEE